MQKIGLQGVLERMKHFSGINLRNVSTNDDWEKSHKLNYLNFFFLELTFLFYWQRHVRLVLIYAIWTEHIRSIKQKTQVSMQRKIVGRVKISNKSCDWFWQNLGQRKCYKNVASDFHLTGKKYNFECAGNARMKFSNQIRNVVQKDWRCVFWMAKICHKFFKQIHTLT